MQTQAGGVRSVCEGAVAVVAIQRGAIVREISLKNVELAIAVEVADRRSHAGLFASVFVEGGACDHRDISEGAVVIVPIENAGCAIATITTAPSLMSRWSQAPPST